MKGLRLRREVEEYQPRPRGYGLAYRSPERLGAVCYPIPLNVVVRAWRWFYFLYLVQGRPDRWERKLAAAHRAGEEYARRAPSLRRMRVP